MHPKYGDWCEKVDEGIPEESGRSWESPEELDEYCNDGYEKEEEYEIRDVLRSEHEIIRVGRQYTRNEFHEDNEEEY